MAQTLTDLTLRAVTQQIAAMGADPLDIGVLDPSCVDDDGQPDPIMQIRVTSAGQVPALVPFLKSRNAAGCHIYVRPSGTHHFLTLIDDLKKDALAAMRGDRLAPAAVIETSPGNFQAWIRHPERLDPAVNTQLARILASRYDGDAASADWRHFGRLAGFTNRKPAYRNPRGQFPFCLLSVAKGAVSDLAADIQAARDSIAAEAERLQRQAAEYAARAAYVGGARGGIGRDIASFHGDPRYAGDLTRADLAYAVYALSRGLSEPDVAATLAARDLSHKGGARRQQEYVERTINKARSAALQARS